MIVNAVFVMLGYILSIVLSVVDVAGQVIPDGIVEFLGTMLQASLLLDPLIPVRTLYLLVASVVSLEALIATYKLMMWLYEQVRKITRSA